MAQIKAMWILAELLGISTVLMGIVDNIDNVRSVILFIVALSYLMFRMYFFVVKNKQDVRDKELDLWHKERDKDERRDKINKKPT